MALVRFKLPSDPILDDDITFVSKQLRLSVSGKEYHAPQYVRLTQNAVVVHNIPPWEDKARLRSAIHESFDSFGAVHDIELRCYERYLATC